MAYFSLRRHDTSRYSSAVIPVKVFRAAAFVLEKTSRMQVGRAWHDPALDLALRRVRAGRLERGLDLIRQARDDHELRALRVTELATAAEAHLDALEQLAGDDPDALLWLGAARVQHAWELRDDLTGRFHEQLATAAEPLRRAAEADPADPVPWDVLQWQAMGLGDRDELDRLWEELTSRAPRLFAGHYTRAQALCGKWHGSDEEVLAFARTAAATARPGDLVTAMLPLAHFEVAWSEIAASGRDAQEVLESHFRDPYVAEELIDAVDTWHARPRPHPRSVEAMHLFGAAFYYGGHHARAQSLLMNAGRRVPEILPWSAGSLTPGRRYARARRELGLD